MSLETAYFSFSEDAKHFHGYLMVESCECYEPGGRVEYLVLSGSWVQNSKCIGFVSSMRKLWKYFGNITSHEQ